jgi:hypothetical protein
MEPLCSNPFILPGQNHPARKHPFTLHHVLSQPEWLRLARVVSLKIHEYVAAKDHALRLRKNVQIQGARDLKE